MHGMIIVNAWRTEPEILFKNIIHILSVCIHLFYDWHWRCAFLFDSQYTTYIYSYSILYILKEKKTQFIYLWTNLNIYLQN